MASYVKRAPRGDVETITQPVRHSAVAQGGLDCHGNGQEHHTPPVSISGRAQGVGEQRGRTCVTKCPACCMVWYGMVWYGMVWYGMVWYGMVFARFPCLLALEVDGWASGDIPHLSLFRSTWVSTAAESIAVPQGKVTPASPSDVPCHWP